MKSTVFLTAVAIVVPVTFAKKQPSDVRRALLDPLKGNKVHDTMHFMSINASFAWFMKQYEMPRITKHLFLIRLLLIVFLFLFKPHQFFTVTTAVDQSPHSNLLYRNDVDSVGICAARIISRLIVFVKFDKMLQVDRINV